MAGPTLSDRVEALTKQLHQLEVALASANTNNRIVIENLKDRLADCVKSDEQHATKLAEQSIKIATLEQRCAALEKLSDRSWQVWLALIVAGIGLVVSLLKS